MTTDLLIVHSSDLHVGDGGRDEAHSGLSALQAVLATATALAADLVLLAGDTFDNHRVPTPTLQQAAGLLAGAGRPVVLLPGNHDPVMPACLFRRAGIVGLPQVHVLGVTDPDSVLFEPLGLEVWGHPHSNYDEMAPLRTPKPRRTRWQVVMAHGHYVPPEDDAIRGQRGWEIGDADIAATGADYVAMGHWDRAVRIGDGRVPAYYSGSPHLVRTVNLVRLGPDGVTVDREPLRWTDQPEMER